MPSVSNCIRGVSAFQGARLEGFHCRNKKLGSLWIENNTILTQSPVKDIGLPLEIQHPSHMPP